MAATILPANNGAAKDLKIDMTWSRKGVRARVSSEKWNRYIDSDWCQTSDDALRGLIVELFEVWVCD